MRLLLLLLLASGGASAQSGLQDPMRPPTAAAVAPRTERALGARERRAPDYVLESTITGAGAPRALINGRLLAAGDEVDGARVLSIQPGRAVLDSRGQRIEVTLWPEAAVKQPTRSAP